MGASPLPRWSLHQGWRQAAHSSVCRGAQTGHTAAGAAPARCAPRGRAGTHSPPREAKSTQRRREAAALHPVRGLRVKEEGKSTLQTAQLRRPAPASLPVSLPASRPPRPSGSRQAGAGREGLSCRPRFTARRVSRCPRWLPPGRGDPAAAVRRTRGGCGLRPAGAHGRP